MIKLITATLVVVLASISSTVLARSDATVLYDYKVRPVAQTLADPTDLWVKPKDLPSVNGFELKPEGACFEDICVPVKRDSNSRLYVKRQGQEWFNVTELASLLDQPVVADYDERVFSFGAIPVSRQRFTEQKIAPDFTLPDRHGNSVTLSDFKGKKIMLLSWASW